MTIAAGVSFTINGSYPDPIADSDVDVGWAITSPEAYGNVTVTGAINASGNALIKGYIVDLDALDVAGNLDILTTYQYGTVTLNADLDVTGQTTILAYQVDHTGDNFTAAAELEIGNTSKSSYINLAGVFHASKSVTLNGYRTVFDGTSFTMDGTNSADKLITESNLKIEATDVISIKGDVQTNRDVNLLFFCDGEVATGSITIDNEGSAGTAGQLCIKANRSGGTTSEFIIGGSSAKCPLLLPLP